METLTKKNKRTLKRIGKIIMERKRPTYHQDPRILIHRVTSDDFDGYDAAYLVAASDESELRDAMRYCECLDGYTWTSAYDCTGRPFYDPAIIKKINSNRYLVKFHVNYDV